MAESRAESTLGAHLDEAKRIAPDAVNPSEHASWTMVANVLLNMDETLTKE